MQKTKRPSILGNEKGLAMLETVPLLILFVVLISFGMGFFGIIHTAVLHSIGARTYAFETFRNRSNLYFFRENGSGVTRPINFKKKQWRYHAVQHESDPRERFVATSRPISFPRGLASSDMSVEQHNVQVYSMEVRNDRFAVNPAWVMVGYGICLNAECGQQQ